MKNTVKFFAIILIFAVFSACENFLDSADYTTKDENSFPQSEKDANQMLVGVYAILNVSHAQGINSWLQIAELASDDRFGGGGVHDKECQAFSHFLYNNPNQFNTFWSDRYTGISRATSAIAALELMPDGDLKNQKIGEARFLRANWYFELVQLLGDIPLLKELPEDVSEALKPPAQAPQEEVFKMIATDLWDAYSTMPSLNFDQFISGTVTKWAAGAMLARVYLFYTGFYKKPDLPTETGSVTKQQVIEALADIIAYSGHDLLPDFRTLWPYTNSVTKKDYEFATDAPTWVEGSKNREVIFAIKMNSLGNWETTVGYSNSNCLFFGIRSENTNYEDCFPIGGGWGFGPVNTKLWNVWPAEDPRRTASIWNYANPEENAGAYKWGSDSQMEETGMWQKKIVATTAYGKGGDPTSLYNSFWSDPAYGDRAGDDFQLGHGSDLMIIRFADVLLMHAELTETVDGINKVRARANASKNPAGTLPMIAAYSLQALQDERHWELAFEGLRWGDIRRWGIAAEKLNDIYGAPVRNIGNQTVMKPQKAGLKTRYEQTNGFFNKPQDQITLAGDETLLKQNPGWTGEGISYDGWVD